MNGNKNDLGFLKHGLRALESNKFTGVLKEMECNIEIYINKWRENPSSGSYIWNRYA